MSNDRTKQLSEAVKVTASNSGIVSFYSKVGSALIVLGCSKPCSVDGVYDRPKTSQHTIHNFYLTLKQGEKALIALKILKDGFAPTFILAKWSEGEDTPKVDLTKPWEPTDPDRIGQILYDKHYTIMTIVKGIRYSYCDQVIEEQRQDFGYLPYNGGKIICQYLIGDIDFEEFRSHVEFPNTKPLIKRQMQIINTMIEDFGNEIKPQKNPKKKTKGFLMGIQKLIKEALQ